MLCLNAVRLEAIPCNLSAPECTLEYMNSLPKVGCITVTGNEISNLGWSTWLPVEGMEMPWQHCWSWNVPCKCLPREPASAGFQVNPAQRHAETRPDFCTSNTHGRMAWEEKKKMIQKLVCIPQLFSSILRLNVSRVTCTFTLSTTGWVFFFLLKYALETVVIFRTWKQKATVFPWQKEYFLLKKGNGGVLSTNSVSSSFRGKCVSVVQMHCWDPARTCSCVLAF